MIGDSSVADASFTPDPISVGRQVKRTLVISRGLLIMVNAPLIIVLGPCMTVHSIYPQCLWAMLLSINGLLLPIWIRRMRARKGLGFIGKNEDIRPTAKVTGVHALLLITLVISSMVLASLQFWFPHSEWVFASVALLLASYCIRAYVQMRLWELLMDSAAFVLLAFMILAFRDISRLIIEGAIVVGVAMFITGLSWHIRWVRWSRSILNG
jgi:hypothetical protein